MLTDVAAEPIAGLVSVVMPCFNNAAYIKQALCSVFEQTYSPMEVIVVDDGSTDDSAELLAQLQSRYAFTVVRQPNRGVSAALNLGLALAKGEFVITPDSDDVLLPQAVATRVSYLKRYPGVGLVGGKVIYTNAEGEETKREALQGMETYSFARLLANAHAVGAPVAMYRMAALRAVGFYNPAIRIQDFQITLRIAYAGYGVACVPTYITRYRRHGANLSRKYRQQLSDDLAAIAPYRDHPAWRAGRTAVINKALKYSVRDDHVLSWRLLRQVPIREWNAVTLKRARGLLSAALRVPFSTKAAGDTQRLSNDQGVG